jgi:hypothetical protein
MEEATPVNHSALLDVALAAAARGWHVFPLRPGDKLPAFPDHAVNGCTGSDPRCRAAGRHVMWEERATTDPDRIRRAWSVRPYNVGIACGPSGLLVVDLDTPKPGQAPPPEWTDPPVRDGADVFGLLCARHTDDGPPEMFDTYTVRTAGAGTHLYYQHPPDSPPLRNTRGDIGGGLGWLVDTRAHGGYVVAAGSVVNGRPYVVQRDVEPRPLAGWLAGLLRPAPLPAAGPVVARLRGAGRTAAYLRACVDRQIGYLTAATSNRNDALFISAANLGELVAGGALEQSYVEDVLTEAAHTIGLHLDPPPGQIRRTIASGLRRGARRPRHVPA